MKTKEFIKKLETKRKLFIKKYEKEPEIWFSYMNRGVNENVDDAKLKIREDPFEHNEYYISLNIPELKFK